MDQLCTSGSCCQTDSYASPYTLLYKNHTQTQIGGRYYSTFFYDLKASHACRADLDNKQCCTASVDTVWIDVGK